MTSKSAEINTAFKLEAVIVLWKGSTGRILAYRLRKVKS